MAVNSAKVLVGTPDQLTTGAILNAPLGTALPTNAGFTFDTAVWSDSGYISEDGLEISPDYSTTDIPDWSGANVRRLLEQFTGEITWTHLETSANSLKATFGEDNVTVTQATRDHGEKMVVTVGARLPERRSWAFKIKDGDAKILIVVPNGQVTSVDTITFSSSDAIKWPVTLSTYADEQGNNIYIYTDDGVYAAG